MAADTPNGQDKRPQLAIGHLELLVSDVGSAVDLFVKLGMRHIFQKEDFAVLELRGGTHLVLDKPEGPVPSGREAPFDLMVDDIEMMRERCESLELQPSSITNGRVHRSFSFTGPDGYMIEVNSSHASGEPV